MITRSKTYEINYKYSSLSKNFKNTNKNKKKYKFKKVYDILKNGVMLAHNYKDPVTNITKKPLNGFPQAPNGWFLSEKYDGYRAIWDGYNFRSRNNNIFKVPKWFKAWMPSGICLDGELFLGREKFFECSIFRKKKPLDEEWLQHNVQYKVFDCPSHNGTLEKRINYIKKIINNIYSKEDLIKKEFNIPKNILCPLKITKHIKVKNDDDVNIIFNKLVSKGAEGIMLRAPNSFYDGKRSANLLKYKPLYDDECIIKGYKEGSGKYIGMLGGFKCVLKTNKNIRFDVSNMTDKIRKNYIKSHPINTIITFSYMGLTNHGIPRHPQYLRIRKSE